MMRITVTMDKLRLSRKTLAEVLEHIKTTPGSVAWWTGDERDVWIEKTERQIAVIDTTITRYDKASRPRSDKTKSNESPT